MVGRYTGRGGIRETRRSGIQPARAVSPRLRLLIRFGRAPCSWVTNLSRPSRLSKHRSEEYRPFFRASRFICTTYSSLCGEHQQQYPTYELSRPLARPTNGGQAYAPAMNLPSMRLRSGKRTRARLSACRALNPARYLSAVSSSASPLALQVSETRAAPAGQVGHPAAFRLHRLCRLPFRFAPCRRRV